VKGVVCLVALAAAGLLVATAAVAAGPTVPWHPKDMKTAIRALDYPLPHPRSLGCKGQGHNVYGRYDSWLCHATYTHRRSRAFVMGGEGAGGWLCAGRTLKTCRVLRHGFATTFAVKDFGGLEKIAEIASPSYVQIHDGSDSATLVPDAGCTKSGTRTWSCQVETSTSRTTVTISFEKAEGGWITTGSESPS
jgi:hypothetical protein